MEELRFSSKEEALQYLSNMTGSRIKIASNIDVSDPGNVMDIFWSAVEEYVFNNLSSTLGWKLVTTEEFEGYWSGKYYRETRTSPEEFPEFEIESGEVEIKDATREVDLKKVANSNDWFTEEELLDPNNEVRKVIEANVSKPHQYTTLILDDDDEEIDHLESKISGTISGNTLKINIVPDNKDELEKVKEEHIEAIVEELEEASKDN